MAALRSVPVLLPVDDCCTPDKVSGSKFDRSGGRPVLSRRRSIDDQNNRLTVQPIRKSTSQQSLTQLQSNIIKSFGQKIRKTKAELDRSGWIHAFYIFVLLIYSAIGGLLFMALDGEASDRTIAEHHARCSDDKEKLWSELTRNCTDLLFVDCSDAIRSVIDQLEFCSNEETGQITVLSTNIYTNALIYAITVYTTIGYGNVLVSSTSGRVATIVYTIIGTPLFFAFLNDMGQWFQRLFLMVYFKLRRFIKCRSSFWAYLKPSSRKLSGVEQRKISTTNVFGDGADDEASAKPGLIFTCAVIFLILYLIVCTMIFYFMEKDKWNFFESFYFLFTSISLIGFGDYFPQKPNSLLFTILFIIVGISLLSMCFFILQEWIRKNTSKLSRRVRSSVRQWRSTHPFPVMYQNRHSTKHLNHRADVNCNLDLDNGNCVSSTTTSPTSSLVDNNNKRFAPPRRCSSSDTVLGGDAKHISGAGGRNKLREFGRSQSSMNFFFRRDSFKLKKIGRTNNKSGGLGKCIVANRLHFVPSSKTETATISDDEIA